ncbi:MAG: hypothetical protein IJ310_05255 [Clostridia bacterium]|nr:hypothetical protein [Clostridia bacterium]
MKNLKRIFTSLMFMLAVVVGSFASVNFNKTTTASANTEPVAIENGRTINAAIKGFIDSGAEFTSILHADETLFAGYETAAYKAAMTDMADQVLHLWVSEDSLYYYTMMEGEPGVCFLPVDSSLMFSYLTTVEIIDLIGFDSAMATTTTNMFEGCTALKEVTFNSSTVSLYDELTTLWTGDIYNKETGNKISGGLNIDDGTLTVTIAVNVKPEEPTTVCKFDLRNGNGLVSPDGEFNYNPTSKYSFYGWSTELDGIAIVDKTQGNNVSNYDSGDFAGGNYYAVWKNNDKIVVTSGLDLTTLETVDKISTHGYSWDATNKILTINDLTLDVVDLVNVEDNKYCIYSSNTFSIIIASDSDNKITSNISGAIAIGGDVSISYSDTIGRLTIETSTGIVATNSVSLIGGNINLNCTTGSAIIVDNEENDAEVVIGSQRNMQTINLYVTSNANKVITADVVSVCGADAVFEANAPWGYAVYCSGFSVGFESTANLSSGTTSPCVYAKNVSVTGDSILEAVSTSNAAIVTENKITLDTYRGVIKAGADKQSATFVSEYTNEKYVIIKYHKFNFAQSADGKTYTATCENEDCCLENNKIEMSLSISNKVYDGNAISFDVLNKDAFLNETGVEYIGAEFEGVYGTEYAATSTAPTGAGKYKISIKARVATINSSVILSAEFEIYKADSSITSVPTIKDNLIFNGEAQALINAGAATGGILNYKLEGGEYSAAIPTATNVGEYKVYYKVVGDANHNDTEEGFVTVVTSPKRVEIDWCENNFTYNGNVQSVTATYRDVSNVKIDLSVSVSSEFRNAGEYTATASFKFNETNYKLPTVVTKVYNIAKFKVAKPQADARIFAYTGAQQTYQIAVSDYYTISNNIKTEVGTYSVGVTLKDKNNTEWSDSTTADLTYEFVINQVSFNAAEDASGNPNTDVKVESINGGVAPNAKLVVETVDVSSATQKARLAEAIGLAANKEVLSAIDIKFVLNTSEVQPNGKVVVKIKVPTAVDSKSFELYHVHEELGETTAAKLTYSAVDAQGYITVEVENFSEFVFVAEKEVVPPPVAPKETNITPWIIMGILGLFLVLFFIWFYGLKKQKYDIVSKIVISLFEVVAVVLVCLYKGTDLLPYIIVDLVAFVGVDVLYMYNTSKEELKETKQTSTSEEIKA